MTGTQIINIHVFNTPLTLILSFFLLNWVHYQFYKNAPTALLDLKNNSRQVSQLKGTDGPQHEQRKSTQLMLVEAYQRPQDRSVCIGIVSDETKV